MAGIRTILTVLAIAALLAALSAPVVAQQRTMQVESSNKDMMSTLAGMNNTAMASSLLNSADMGNMLAGMPHTLFIPTDSAMGNMGVDKDRMSMLKSDRTLAARAMQGFIANGMIKPSDMTNGKTIPMLSGRAMTVRNVNGQMSLDGARITRAIQTNNGMIYMIDSMPSSMISTAMVSR